MATVLIFDQSAPSAAISENATINARERQKSLMLRAWIVSGLFFMALPGTLLGFSNLMAISAHHGLGTLPAAWMEGHGHAQMFGWIGSFILGIGFYSQPTHGRLATRLPQFCYLLWTSGVAMRWFANIYGWQWRTLLPLSAGFELVAVILFLYAASHHKRSASIQDDRTKTPMELWMVSVLIGTAGLASAVIFNFVECVRLGLQGGLRSFPHALDQKYLVLLGWGFVVPVVWGFSARWLPSFLRISKPNVRWFRVALCLDVAGVLFGVTGLPKLATILFAISAVAIGVGSPFRRAASWLCHHSRYSSQFLNLCAFAVCVAHRRCVDECVGCICRCTRRYLGCISSRAHGWIRSNHGVRNRAAHSAPLRRCSESLQQAPHVSKSVMSPDRMSAARFF